MFLRKVSLRMNQNCWRKCGAVLRNPRGNRIFVRLSPELASKSSSFWSSTPALAPICSTESLILTRTYVRWIDLHAARINDLRRANCIDLFEQLAATVSPAPPFEKDNGDRGSGRYGRGAANGEQLVRCESLSGTTSRRGRAASGS